MHVAVVVNGLILDCEYRVGVRQRLPKDLSGLKWEAAKWAETLEEEIKKVNMK